MSVDERFIASLIQNNDPLPVIWRQMEGWYALEEFPQDLLAFLNGREEALNTLEQAVYEGFYEAYDLLLEKAQSQDGSFVSSLLEECPLVVIADSLSVREAGLLGPLWQGRWEVQGEGFAVAPFPPVTASLCRQLLGTSGPAGGRDTPYFCYRYAAGPEQILAMAPSGPLLVWLRLPDTALEQVTMAQASTIAEAFHKTAQNIERVLEASGRAEAIIISDHGYIYARSPSHYWPMPRGLEQTARQVFRGASRAQGLDDDKARALRHQESELAERRYFALTETHVALRGRYWWGTTSPNDPCTAHGGLSFVECLVPVIRVRRR